MFQGAYFRVFACSSSKGLTLDFFGQVALRGTRLLELDESERAYRIKGRKGMTAKERKKKRGQLFMSAKVVEFDESLRPPSYEEEIAKLPRWARVYSPSEHEDYYYDNHSYKEPPLGYKRGMSRAEVAEMKEAQAAYVERKSVIIFSVAKIFRKYTDK